jgi:predicted MFS family arabinose efflux permease
VLCLPVAFLLGRVGLRRAGLLALGCSVGGAMLGALSPGIGLLLASRVLEGVGMAVVAIVCPAVISLWFEPKDVGQPMGVWAAWVPLGNVTMFNLAPVLLRAFGWRSVWWFGALLSLAALGVFAWVVREPRPDGEPASQRRSDSPSLRHVLRPTAWLLGACFCALSFCLIGYNTWAPTYLHDTLQMDAAAASSYASLLFLAGIAANLVAGWVMDHTVHRYRVLQAAFVATGLVFYWSFRLGSVGAIAPYMVAVGLASNLIPTSLFTLAPESMGAASLAGLAVAILTVASNVGVLAGPPALGALIGGGQWAAGSGVLMAVLGAGLVASLLAGRAARNGVR